MALELYYKDNVSLAGNVANMSRHVGDDTTCRSNFGQMGPCRRHKIEDVVAVCVGLSRHLPDFRNSYVELYYGMGVHTHRYPTLISVMFWFCHVLAVDNAHPYNTDKNRKHSQFTQ